MRILGIETSCDETSASVVEDGFKLLSNITASSVDLHIAYGGVVPEIAARSHIESILPVINQALTEALPNPQSPIPNPCDLWSQIDAIAVTYGPGLSGSLLIGVMTARTLAIAKNKPLYAVNHVSAHPYAVFITDVNPKLKDTYVLPNQSVEFPALALIVSGGHTQLVLYKSHTNYELLGRTTDDAVGEAFDKVAKITGLPYPGGPSVAKSAVSGTPDAIKLPIAKTPGKYDFSYSGLKTAVLRASQALIGEDFTFASKNIPERLSTAQISDISASFQYTAIKTLVDKTKLAFDEYSPKSVVVAGGVAANQELRRQLADALPISPIFPDIKLCTDNGAMIAVYAYYMASNNLPSVDPYLIVPDPNLSM